MVKTNETLMIYKLHHTTMQHSALLGSSDNICMSPNGRAAMNILISKHAMCVFSEEKCYLYLLRNSGCVVIWQLLSRNIRHIVCKIKIIITANYCRHKVKEPRWSQRDTGWEPKCLQIDTKWPPNGQPPQRDTKQLQTNGTTTKKCKWPPGLGRLLCKCNGLHITS